MPTIRQRSNRTAVQQVLAASPARPKGKAKKQETLLTDWAGLPSWLRDNEFIVNHYRVDWTPWQSIKSIFRIHNETGNIWTHLLGFLLFVGLTFITAYLRPAPLLLGKELLWKLETSLMDAGRASMHELFELEQRLMRFGLNSMAEFQVYPAAGYNALCETLCSCQQMHAAELLDVQRRLGEHHVNSLRDVEERLLQYGRDGMHSVATELQVLRRRLVALVHVDWRHLQGVTGFLDVRWPSARWPVYVFTAGAMVCLLTSTVCHTLGCCSRHVANWIWRIDYCGIAVLIVTSFYPPVFYAFQCKRQLLLFYLFLTTAMGVGAVFVSLLPVFQTTEYRPIRAGMFAGMGLWGIVPMVHGASLYWGQTEVKEALLYDAMMGIIYLAGAAIYACRVPERWKPGAFDLAFHSHQIFHVAVVLAALVHYKSVLILLHWRDSILCTAG